MRMRTVVASIMIVARAFCKNLVTWYKQSHKNRKFPLLALSNIEIWNGTELLNRTPRSLILLEWVLPLPSVRGPPRFQWKLVSIETFRLIDYCRIWDGLLVGGECWCGFRWKFAARNKWRKFAFWLKLKRDWLSIWCDWTTCRCRSFQMEVRTYEWKSITMAICQCTVTLQRIAIPLVMQLTFLETVVY